MAEGRPQAVSVTDELLVHVLDVLAEIRDRLPDPKPEPKAGRTTVSEPAKRTATPTKATPAKRGSRGDH